MVAPWPQHTMAGAAVPWPLHVFSANMATAADASAQGAQLARDPQLLELELPSPAAPFASLALSHQLSVVAPLPGMFDLGWSLPPQPVAPPPVSPWEAFLRRFAVPAQVVEQRTPPPDVARALFAPPPAAAPWYFTPPHVLPPAAVPVISAQLLVTAPAPAPQVALQAAAPPPPPETLQLPVVVRPIPLRPQETPQVQAAATATAGAARSERVDRRWSCDIDGCARAFGSKAGLRKHKRVRVLCVPWQRARTPLAGPRNHHRRPGMRRVQLLLRQCQRVPSSQPVRPLRA